MDKLIFSLPGAGMPGQPHGRSLLMVMMSGFQTELNEGNATSTCSSITVEQRVWSGPMKYATVASARLLGSASLRRYCNYMVLLSFR